MARSLLHTGPSLVLKVARKAAAEQTIGFATGLQFSVTQGQKEHYVVDSPMAVQLSQGSAPSIVRGQLTLYLPKGSTPEKSGLVAYRQDKAGGIFQTNSEYLSFRLYDRFTGDIVFSCDSVKVSDYTVAVRTRATVQVVLNFTGLFLTQG